MDTPQENIINALDRNNLLDAVGYLMEDAYRRGFEQGYNAATCGTSHPITREQIREWRHEVPKTRMVEPSVMEGVMAITLNEVRNPLCFRGYPFSFEGICHAHLDGLVSDAAKVIDFFRFDVEFPD